MQELRELKRKKILFYLTGYGLQKPENVPSHTNKCRLFWRTVGMILVGWFAVAIYYTLGLIAGLVGLAILVGIGVLFCGHRPGWKEKDPEMFMPIFGPRWPKIGGKPVWPVFVYIPTLLAYWVWTHTSAIYEFFVELWGFITQPVVVSFTFTVLFLGVVFVVIGSARKADWWLLFRDYLKARKEKFCPIIPIEPLPPEPEPEPVVRPYVGLQLIDEGKLSFLQCVALRTPIQAGLVTKWNEGESPTRYHEEKLLIRVVRVEKVAERPEILITVQTTGDIPAGLKHGECQLTVDGTGLCTQLPESIFEEDAKSATD
jgi:hypothetical protein